MPTSLYYSDRKFALLMIKRPHCNYCWRIEGIFIWIVPWNAFWVCGDCTKKEKDKRKEKCCSYYFSVFHRKKNHWTISDDEKQEKAIVIDGKYLNDHTDFFTTLANLKWENEGHLMSYKNLISSIKQIVDTLTDYLLVIGGGDETPVTSIDM